MNRLWILYQRKISEVIGDMLYILQHFNLNFISFFFVNTVVFYNYCPTSPSRLLRKLWTSVKGNDWQSKWNMSCFWRYYHVLSKHWQPSCSKKVFDCNAMAWNSVIHKSKLLCGSINKHGMWTKKYFMV